MPLYLIHDTAVTACERAPDTVSEGALLVRSAQGLHKSSLPNQRLVAIWNALPGVAPVTKFKDRATAVRRLWAAFATLTPVAAPEKRRRGDNAATARTARPASKQAQVVALLRRPTGATLDDLVAATGWQRHTVRGVLAGTLKKKLGFTIRSEKSAAGTRVYRIVA
jgi:hypothetical protein